MRYFVYFVAFEFFFFSFLIIHEATSVLPTLVSTSRDTFSVLL